MAKVELTWPGKRADLAGARLASEDDLELVECIGGRGENLVVHGDNLLCMHALRKRIGGKIKLIYIDPPYATGLSYYTLTDVGDAGAAIERRAYRDQRAGGMVGYLEHMHERLSAMHGLLADDGHLFLHCDWRANSALRILLDEIFGADAFRNEIVWRRAPNLGRQAASSQLGRVIDSILVYSKTPGSKFPGPVPKRRQEVALDRKGKPKGARWDDDRECYFTTAPRGDYTDASIAMLRTKGRVYDSSTGKVYIKYFLTKGEDGRWYKEQPVDTLWDDFEVRPLRHRPKSEDMGYDTQKPEGLLERIIGWASAPGDLVADFYAGSGTTAAVAEAMGRRWLTTDIGTASIAVLRRRLLDMQAKPFEIRSLLAAERRLWSGDVLDAYGESDAEVFIDPPDVAACCAAANSKAVDVLAWSWNGDDAAKLRQDMRDEHGVTLTMRTIPIELARVASKRAKLSFAVRPEATLEVVRQGDHTTIKLAGVRIVEPPLKKGVELSWQDMVDAWMIGWGEGPFTPRWRSYRTRRDRELAFETPQLDVGDDVVVVKVLTIFGQEIIRRL